MTKKKLFADKSPEELNRLAAEFDEPNVIDRSRPLTPEERADWERWRPRPQRGRRRRISLTVAEQLLTRADRLAKRLHVNRSALVVCGLERLLERLEEPKRKRSSA